MDKISLMILGIIFGVLLVIFFGFLCFRDMRKNKQGGTELKRGIRIVMDSADSDAFYAFIETIRANKPSILGAQYNDTITDTITVNLIVKEDGFSQIFQKIREIENLEAAEAEIEIMEESK